MSDPMPDTFEAQLRAAARDIVETDLAAAPPVDVAAAAAIVAATPAATAAPSAPAPRPARRIALWPTVGAAAACLAIGYVLPHPSSGTSAPAAPTAQVERIEVVRTDTVVTTRPIVRTVVRTVEHPVVQTVEVVRTDTIVVAPPAAAPRHAPRSLADDGFIYAYSVDDE